MSLRLRHRAVVPGVLAVIALVALGTFALAKPDASRLQVGPLEINAAAIAHFDKARPGQSRFGKLEFRGGLILTSSHSDFGGWSGLAADPDGRRILAVSDAGSWLTAEIAYDGTRPKALSNARIGPIVAVGSKRLARERDRDAEAVRLVEGTLSRGVVLVAFERNHRIGRFSTDERGLGAPAGYLKMPAEARRMTTNKGMEAVGLLLAGPYKGSPYAFSERLYDAGGNHTGWIWVKGEPRLFNITNIDDFDITDTTGLADGSILVLERRYRVLDGVRMRIRRFATADLKPGAVLAGEILIAADNGQEIDNMEGLAVHRTAAGETVLTLISDNNFNEYVQRTILLQFKLVEDPVAAR